MYKRIVERLEAINAYIKRNYLDEEHHEVFSSRIITDFKEKISAEIENELKIHEDIEGYINKYDAKTPFAKMLISLIDRKGLNDVEVYQRALIDRRHFSKIRSNANYQPTKPTVIAFILALELNLDQAIDLLKSAGFAFSTSNKADLILRYCIEEEIYNIDEVNYALYCFGQSLIRV